MYSLSRRSSMEAKTRLCQSQTFSSSTLEFSSTHKTSQPLPYHLTRLEADKLSLRLLSEMVHSFTSSRISSSPSDNPSAVLPSSTELFYFYREALDRCARLSVRQPLLDLCKVYRKWLKTYAEDVLNSALIKFDRRSGEGRPNLQELQTACLVLNTGEYCLETAAQVSRVLTQLLSKVAEFAA
jgi:hypothetical protein